VAIARWTKKIPVGEGRVRHRVIVFDNPSPKGTHEAVLQFRTFIQLLADDQHLLACGYGIPERLVVEHNGTAWQATAEAEIDEPPA